jgi:hypothetical protein
MPENWKIDGLGRNEVVLAVAPILGGVSFSQRLVLTDRRLMTISSHPMASDFGLARFTGSKILDSTSITQIESVCLTRAAAGFFATLEVTKSDGNSNTYQATGIGSRWLRRLTKRLPQDRIRQSS